MSLTTTRRTAAEELGPLDNENSSTGYEPNDHFSTEASAEYTQETTTEQRFTEDLDYDDITIGQTLLTACRRRAGHSEGEGLSSSLSSSSTSRDRTEKPVDCRDASHAQGHEIQRQNSESEQIRTFLDWQSAQILADCQAEIPQHELQAEKNHQKLNEIIESQKEERHRAGAEEQRRQDHQLLHGQLLKQNWDLREAHDKSLNAMEEKSDFKALHSIQFRGEDWSKIEILSLKSQARFRNYRMKSTARRIREIFEHAESVRSGHSHVTSQLVSFPPHPVPAGMLSRSNRNAEPQRWAAKHLGHTWYIGKRFRKSSRVFFSTLSAGSESMEFS